MFSSLCFCLLHLSFILIALWFNLNMLFVFWCVKKIPANFAVNIYLTSFSVGRFRKRSPSLFEYFPRLCIFFKPFQITSDHSTQHYCFFHCFYWFLFKCESRGKLLWFCKIWLLGSWAEKHWEVKSYEVAYLYLGTETCVYLSTSLSG